MRRRRVVTASSPASKPGTPGPRSSVCVSPAPPTLTPSKEAAPPSPLPPIQGRRASLLRPRPVSFTNLNLSPLLEPHAHTQAVAEPLLAPIALSPVAVHPLSPTGNLRRTAHSIYGDACGRLSNRGGLSPLSLSLALPSPTSVLTPMSPVGVPVDGASLRPVVGEDAFAPLVPDSPVASLSHTHSAPSRVYVSAHTMHARHLGVAAEEGPPKFATSLLPPTTALPRAPLTRVSSAASVRSVKSPGRSPFRR